MNRYQVKLSNETNDDNGNNNDNQNNNKYRRGNYNNGGFNNQFSPGRNNQRGYRNNSPANEGDIETNPNIGETQWNHSFGAVLCPETMNDMKEQNKFLPKFNGSQLCLRYHAKESCYKNCMRGATHVKLHGR